MNNQIVLFSGISRLFSGRPLAIHRLASHLRENNFSVKPINFFNYMSDEIFRQLVDMYINDKTLLVGFSATVLVDHAQGNFFGIPDEQFKQRLAYIKEKSPKVKFVAGGGQFNNLSLDLYSKFGSEFDYLSIGQGENTLLAIAQHLADKTQLITSTIEKPLVISDKTYPFTTFNASKNIFSDDNILPSESLSLELARGCIFKCKFCSYDLTNKKSLDFTKTEENLREELIYNYERFQTQHYYIVDDLINDSTEKIDMLERLAKSLPFKIYLSGYCRLDLLWSYPKMIQQLKDIGLVGVFFGIETVNDRSGRAVGKGLGKKRIEETLKKCADIWQDDVHVEGHFIIGLPHDNRETTQELWNWCERMLNERLIHKVHFSPLSINPMLGKADIDRHPEKFGYTVSQLSSEFVNANRGTRYVNYEANWTTKEYSWKEALQSAEEFNELASSYRALPMLDAFNIGMLTFLTRKILPQNNLVQIATRKTNISEKQLKNLIHLMDIEYQKYIQNYFNHLLTRGHND